MTTTRRRALQLICEKQPITAAELGAVLWPATPGRARAYLSQLHDEGIVWRLRNGSRRLEYGLTVFGERLLHVKA